MQIILLITTFLTSLLAGCQAVAMDVETMTDSDAANYLMEFGFMGESVPDPRIAELMDTDPDMAFQMGVMMFQSMYEEYGLNATGELDDATKELMAMDRCGFKDMMIMEDMPDMTEMSGTRRRKKRYDAVGNRWPNNELTYRIDVYTPDLPREQVDSEIKAGFDVWAEVTPLSFTQVYGNTPADIIIFFRPGAHGDDYPFDGRGGVLAHAYFPFNGAPIEGDAHFDEDELWTMGTNQGTNLFQVGAHEFGHSLGLGHSEFPDALMAPFYRGYVPNFQLHTDDIQGIQVLYGPPDTDMGGDDGMGGPSGGDRSTQPPMTFPPGMPNFCSGSIDSMTAHIEQNVLSNYIFKGDYYVRLDKSGIASGYPRRIDDDWEGISGNIDAAVYLPAFRSQPDYTMIFKADMYYLYGADRNLVRQDTISSFGFPDGFATIDAAFVWGRNGRVYFMQDNTYYRLKRRNKQRKLLRLQTSNARDLDWWNVPLNSLDAAHQWIGNMRTYFFKGQEYYRLNDAEVQVDVANPPYPRNIGNWWLGCNNLVTIENNEDTDISGSATLTVSNVIILSVLLLSLLTILL